MVDWLHKIYQSLNHPTQAFLEADDWILSHMNPHHVPHGALPPARFWSPLPGRNVEQVNPSTFARFQNSLNSQQIQNLNPSRQEHRFNLAEQSATLFIGVAVLMITIYKPRIGISIGFHLGAILYLNERNTQQANIEPLLNQATEHLQNWTPQHRPPFDWGHFLIAQNFARNPSISRDERNDIEQKWEGLSRYFDSQNQSDLLDRADSIYDHLYFNTSLPNTQGLMLNEMVSFLRVNGRGNCHNRAQLVISALAHARLREPYVLAIQTFITHVEPVIYNRETHEVYYPITGEEPTLQIRAPIFYPELWLDFFVRHHGRNSSHNLSEYLIVNADAAHSNQDWRKTLLSPLALPLLLLEPLGANGDGMNQTTPLATPLNYTSNPFDESVGLSAPAHRRRSNDSFSTSEIQANLDELSIEEGNGISDTLGGDDISDVFTTDRVGTPIFRTRAQRVSYERLAGQPEQQKAFVHNLVNASIDHFFERDYIQELVSIMRSPPQQVLPRLSALMTTHPTLATECAQLMRVTVMNSNYLSNNEERDNPHLFDENLNLRNIIPLLRNYSDWTASHTELVFQQIDQAPSSVQVELWGFLASSLFNTSSYNYQFNDQSPSSAVRPEVLQRLQTQALQAQVNRSRFSNNLQEAIPIPEPDSSAQSPYHDILLVSPDFGPLPPSMLAPQIRPFSLEGLAPPGAIQMRGETLLNLIRANYYFGPQNRIASLWTPEVSDWFLHLPHADQVRLKIYYLGNLVEIFRERGVSLSGVPVTLPPDLQAMNNFLGNESRAAH